MEATEEPRHTEPAHCHSHSLSPSPLLPALGSPSPHPQLLSCPRAAPHPQPRALEGVLGHRDATGARAGPGARGAWEPSPAPAFPLCLHVTFPACRKWCRGEVPEGTGQHVTGLQPTLGRAGGNPELPMDAVPKQSREAAPASSSLLGLAPHPLCRAPDGAAEGMVGMQEPPRTWCWSRQGAASSGRGTAMVCSLSCHNFSCFSEFCHFISTG